MNTYDPTADILYLHLPGGPVPASAPRADHRTDDGPRADRRSGSPTRPGTATDATAGAPPGPAR
ncbi:hypothetical protein [Geodermatophilus sp. URMC 62]|uniref:hypothetical protein n=1 Tax=Geodermatophilus sp. URMC 62 TaxID=3423414 RepID=UPI00406D486B